MSPLRSRAPRLLIIGVLALLPIAAIASPSNAAVTSGTNAPGTVHAPGTTHAPGSTHAQPGPVRGLHRIQQAVAPGDPGASFIDGSSNWAGYAVDNLAQDTSATSFNTVSATWTQPAVTCDPADAGENMVADWVGLDGLGNSTVEQGGSMADCNGSSPTYYVWWEMWPYNGVTSVFAINAGDVIHASVTYDQSTSQYDIVVNDATSSQTLTQDIACQATEPACVRGSAEVISETPSGGTDQGGYFLLPDYGTTTFTGVSVTDVNGHTGPLDDPAWNNAEISQTSSDGVTRQTTAPLGADGASFTTTWLAYSGWPQLLTNPGFETGTLSPWSCGSRGAVVTSPVHSGSHAAQVTSTVSRTGECDQAVTLSPNTSYTLSGWLQGNGAHLGVKGDATASQLDSLSGWLNLSMTFTTGSTGAVTVYVQGLSGGGSAYADDLFLHLAQ